MQGDERASIRLWRRRRRRSTTKNQKSANTRSHTHCQANYLEKLAPTPTPKANKYLFSNLSNSEPKNVQSTTWMLQDEHRLGSDRTLKLAVVAMKELIFLITLLFWHCSTRFHGRSLPFICQDSTNLIKKSERTSERNLILDEHSLNSPSQSNRNAASHQSFVQLFISDFRLRNKNLSFSVFHRELCFQGAKHYNYLPWIAWIEALFQLNIASQLCNNKKSTPSRDWHIAAQLITHFSSCLLAS